ncbi:type I methionyl aminopeptidase [Candidatus Roizmanbacteria bacterium]|nr:type I methionyl aminopeptidase [Candidatus Roizmanbacteria bacterium]
MKSVNSSTTERQKVMQEGGEHLSHILNQILSHISPGVTPLELDRLAERLIKQAGGSPSFQTVGDYRWATCICVNDCVVHGIPTSTPLKEGDVVGVDVGILYKGYHTDTSWTLRVQNSKLKTQNSKPDKIDIFLETGEKALSNAITQVKPGNRIGHISRAIQETIEEAGYSVVHELIGHGIGTKLHEEPEVPGVLRKPVSKTPLLREGMMLAIEVIYTMGKPEVYIDDTDGWTIRTKDGTISALFEKTVAVVRDGVLVLTEHASGNI